MDVFVYRVRKYIGAYTAALNGHVDAIIFSAGACWLTGCAVLCCAVLCCAVLCCAGRAGVCRPCVFLCARDCDETGRFLLDPSPAPTCPLKLEKQQTKGIGENSPLVRQLVCEGLERMGVHLDAEANASMAGGRAGVISTPDSRVKVG